MSTFIEYRIGKHVLKDEQKAITAVLLMCLSPASVFLTMAYTEAVFQALTFVGIWLLIVCDAPLLSAVPFAASCLVRSNGVDSQHMPAGPSTRSCTGAAAPATPRSHMHPTRGTRAACRDGQRWVPPLPLPRVHWSRLCWPSYLGTGVLRVHSGHGWPPAHVRCARKRAPAWCAL